MYGAWRGFKEREKGRCASRRRNQNSDDGKIIMQGSRSMCVKRFQLAGILLRPDINFGLCGYVVKHHDGNNSRHVGKKTKQFEQRITAG